MISRLKSIPHPHRHWHLHATTATTAGRGETEQLMKIKGPINPYHKIHYEPIPFS